MPMIPAVCDRCGTFFPSGIAVENASNVSLRNNKSGPCPNCGGLGSVLDGTFDARGNVLSLISGPDITVLHLQRLRDILEAGEKKGRSPSAVAKQIEREIPALKSVAHFVRNQGKKTNLVDVAGLVLAAIAIKQPGPLTEDETMRAIQRALNDSQVRAEQVEIIRIPRLPLTILPPTKRRSDNEQEQPPLSPPGEHGSESHNTLQEEDPHPRIDDDQGDTPERIRQD